MHGRTLPHTIALWVILAIATPAFGQGVAEPEAQPSDNQQIETEPNAQPPQPVNDEGSTRDTRPVPAAINDSEPDRESDDRDRNIDDSMASGRHDIALPSWITPSDGAAQWIMALFSAIATVISIVAVVLLKRTLAATREANSAALQAADAAQVHAQIAMDMQAAKLLVKSARMRSPSIGSQTTARQWMHHDDIDGLLVGVLVQIENIGESHAFVVERSIYCSLGDEPHPPKARTTNAVSDYSVSELAQGDVMIITNRGGLVQIQSHNVEAIRNHEAFLWVSGCAVYRDWFDRVHTTEFMFRGVWAINPANSEYGMFEFAPWLNGD